MRSRPNAWGAALVAAGFCLGPAEGPLYAQTIEDPTGLFGQPLAGATASELASFEAGATAFTRDRSDDPGFGPLYNAVSCAACHRRPVPGGAGAIYNATMHAGVLDAAGEFHLAAGRTSSVVHRWRVRTPKEEDAGIENVPEDANVFSMRQPTLLFGLGLVEAIPLYQLLAREDPDDADGDGVSGRAIFHGGRVGRFGSQNQATSLRGFIKDAFAEEFGLEPDEIPPGELDPIVEFVRLLQPLPRKEVLGAEEGALIFEEIGCGTCHASGFVTHWKPFKTTAAERIDSLALRGVPVDPYSDFLLHDMGPGLDDGVGLNGAESCEYRTAPLWAWRHRSGLLHDGRAQTLDTALRFHGGEAADARAKYLALSILDRQLLLGFLGSI